MEVTKYVLPVVVGAMAAMMLIILGENFINSIYHLAPDTDKYDVDSLAKGMKNIPEQAFVLRLISCMICSFIGGILGTLIAKRETARPAVVIGLVLTFAGLYNFLYLPHPSWFVINLCLYLPCAYLGYLLVRKKATQV